MGHFGNFLLKKDDEFWLLGKKRELILFQMDFPSIWHDFFDQMMVLRECDYSCGKTNFKKCP